MTKRIITGLLLTLIIAGQVRVANLLVADLEPPARPVPLPAVFILVNGHLTAAIQWYGFTTIAINAAFEQIGPEGGTVELPGGTFVGGPPINMHVDQRLWTARVLYGTAPRAFFESQLWNSSQLAK